MRSNRKILFGVIILVAVFVLFGLYSALSRNSGQQANTQPTPGTRLVSTSSSGGDQIAYAAVNLPAHSIITRDMLRMGPRGQFSTANHITDLDSQAVGFVTRVAIPKGGAIEPSNDFVGHISQVGIAGALQPGTRAMVIPIGNKPTLHDLIRIGNYVDVLASFDGQESRTIVQGVRVLGIDVFGNDFPEKSVAMRGPFKADAQGRDVTGAPAASSGDVPAAAPDATPTATPTAPPANAPRPDPAITLEVTPAQAAAIQLAQASGAPLDFLLLPALPGNNTTDPTSNNTPNIDNGTGTAAVPNIVPVSVNKVQIAPYAERKKTVANGSQERQLNTVTSTLKDLGRSVSRMPMGPPPVLPSPSRGNDLVGPARVGEGTPFTPPAPQAPATYTIPVYADGKVVRNETVLTPPQ